MMTDLTVARYYYVFDGRHRRARVLDRQTGQEVAWRALPRVQLIEYVGHSLDSSVLRRFARACVVDTGIEQVPPNTPSGTLWTAACGARERPLRRVRQSVAEPVIRAVTLGIPRGRPNAARLLTVHACTHPDPVDGAIDAAHMHERWAEFSTEEAGAGAVRSVRQGHIDWLLDALQKGSADGGAVEGGHAASG